MRRDKLIKYMREARFIANEHSKDASTKVGAMILDSHDFTQLTKGYNGMPRGVNEQLEARHARPAKYMFFEHAERNAIYNLARRYLKGSIAVITAVPSMSDLRALMSVGVREVFMPAPVNAPEHLATALELFQECGVVVHYFVNGELNDIEPRHARKIKGIYAEALFAASQAKDPHAEATLIVDADYTQLTKGYSGMPRGADDSKMERYEGKLREMWVEGSSRNAIYNSVRHLLKGATGLVTACTCVECARGYAAVGLVEVAYVEPTPDLLSRWKESLDTALTLLHELKVKTTSLTEDDMMDTQV